MIPTVCIINPNSSEGVTRRIEDALASSRARSGARWVCVTSASGPPAIETDDQVDCVAETLADLVAGRSEDAFVIACFSDPGLASARRATRAPVFGIASSSALLCAGAGRRFGVLSISEGSVARHARYFRELGVSSLLAGDRSVGMGVTEMAESPEAIDRLLAVGGALRDEDGADCLILGCTGMVAHRDALQAHLGLPVVDPVLAAFDHAATMVG